MAVRVLNSRVIFRSAASPPLPLAVFRSCVRQVRTVRHPSYSKLGFRLSITGSGSRSSFCSHGGSIRSCSLQSLVDTVMEELEATRKCRQIRVSNKLATSGQLLQDKLEKRTLQKGLLLEFKKDTGRVLLAVAQKPDGKKNWMVVDQRAQSNLDPALLEFAWIELLEKDKSVTIEHLAEMMFGSSEPLESYCAYLLLSNDDVYFTVLETKCPFSLYGPRPAMQVEELLQKKLAKELAEREFHEFIKLLKSAKAMPRHAKPARSSWRSEEKIWHRIEALEAYAIDDFKNEDQRKTAGMILKEMGLAKTSAAALNLLIDIGYFPVHVNLDLLKYSIRTEYPDGVLAAAENLLSESYDLDVNVRKDLTHLKVYAIDVDEADELDDALSATRLQDGRIKVWIHVADPTSVVQPGSIIDKEAMRRGTSIFLPTTTYPMFPEKLAMEGMSLKQGKLCKAITVSVILRLDGSIAEYSVDNSIIKPTYMLTYESASELLHLNLEEEVELKILSEAAVLRFKCRQQQGAVDTATLETRIKVPNPNDPEPLIRLYVEDQADPALRLVSEMMILCGEVIATYGSCNHIPLPYRGQPQSHIDTSTFAHLPEGPVRSSAVVRLIRAAEMDFRKPIRHGVLGLPGYVQFTSPIRRYMDLLAHYQVKAFLRGDSPPFSAGQLEGIASLVNMSTRVVRKLCNSSLRYWILEYLRRQPKERRFSALVLRFIKDRIAAILLVEVGLQGSASMSIGVEVGDEVKVQVEEAHPRDDVLSLKEVPAA